MEISDEQWHIDKDYYMLTACVRGSSAGNWVFDSGEIIAA